MILRNFTCIEKRSNENIENIFLYLVNTSLKEKTKKRITDKKKKSMENPERAKIKTAPLPTNFR